MANRKYPTDILKQARSILEAAKHLDPTMNVGKVTQSQFKGKTDRMHDLEDQIAAALVLLTDLRNQRDALGEDMWDDIKRTRAMGKGRWGDDSSEYEQLGGERRSEIKYNPTKKDETK